MPQTIEVPDFGGVEFPDGMTDDEIVAAIKSNQSSQNQTPLVGSDFINPNARWMPDMQATTRGGPPLSLPGASESFGAFISDIQGANQFGEVLPFVSNVARSIPADVAAGLSLFKRPEGQPATLLPSPTAIAGAIQKNLPSAAEASGNIPAALAGEELPIDAILSAASKEDKVAATIGKISQGLAATAPIAAISALPAAAQKLALIGFTAKMMADAPKIATQLGDELGKPEDQRDPDKLTTLISDAIQVTGFATLGATHLIRSGAKVVSDYANNLTPRGTGISPELETLAPETSKAVTEMDWPGKATAASHGITGTAELSNPELVSIGIKIGSDFAIPIGGERKSGAIGNGGFSESQALQALDAIADNPGFPNARISFNESTKGYGVEWGDPIDWTSGHRQLGKQFGYRLEDVEQYATSNGEPPAQTLTPATDAAEATEPSMVTQAESKNLASDWTSATEETPPETETPRKSPPESGPEIYELGAGAPLPKFANRKMSELDRVTASHSGKIQKSMSEARRAQKEIKSEVPTDRRQAAISIWREASGDIPTLQSWAADAKGKAFKQSAIDAQTLTPKEIAVARKAIAAFDVLERRGNTFDVLQSHRDNYIPHVWDIKKPGTGFGTGMLKQRFRFSKARTFNTFFEGDQAGFKPKTLAIGKLLPAYIHEMNNVIADRQFVRDMVTGAAKDGSPLAAPRGSVRVVDGPSGQAVLVQPKSMREADTSDYRVMPDQPALSNWTWEGRDTAGKPVFVKADLALHPEAYRRINAMLGQSSIRAWYRDPVSGTAQVPRAIVRGLDTAQSAMKREMFGLLAPFHQVQEGTHAIGHLVNPFGGLEKVDLSRSPAQLDAANHGLMLLPDRSSSRVYLEGSGGHSSLLSRGIRKIPKAGEALADVIDGYQDYLFHQYIPALKFKTYEAMVNRNTKLYANELASGEMTPADVKITSAEQANAAYGHLNYALLDRNPTIQHFLQVGLLAPDFLEARSRFTGQGFKGLSSKVGNEQFKAIAILAAAQAGTAFIISNLLGTPYDPKHPFEVVYKGRRYAMRSVPEDIFSMMKDTRQFAYSRVNPLIVKGGVQLATGLNYRGEKIGAVDTLEELLAGYIPIMARSLPGIRSLTETGRNSPTSPLEQLSGSLGLRIGRYSPISQTYQLANDWKDAQKLPKDTGSYPVSKYQQLRYALEDADMERAKAAYDELKKTDNPAKISNGFKESINHPFTGSKANDSKFAASLKGYDREMYDLALRTRLRILSEFRRLNSSSGVMP